MSVLLWLHSQFPGVWSQEESLSITASDFIRLASPRKLILGGSLGDLTEIFQRVISYRERAMLGREHEGQNCLSIKKEKRCFQIP